MMLESARASKLPSSLHIWCLHFYVECGHVMIDLTSHSHLSNVKAHISICTKDG